MKPEFFDNSAPECKPSGIGASKFECFAEC